MYLPRWLRQLLHEKPGERFIRAYRRRRAHEKGKPVLTIGIILGSVFFLLAGAVFMVLPILPGFIFAIPALAVLIGSTRRGAAFLDRSELWIRRIAARFRRRHGSPHTGGQRDGREGPS